MSRLGDYVGFVTGTKLRIFKTNLVPKEDSVSQLFCPSLKQISIKLHPNVTPQSIHFFTSNQTDFVLLVSPGTGGWLKT